MVLHFTGVSNTGKIRKPPAKRAKSPPLLPDQIAFIKELEDETLRNQQAKKVDKLENISWKVHLEWEQSGISDITKSIKDITNSMWIDIPEKGLGANFKAEIFQYRQSLPPLVTNTQLHGLCYKNPTSVDRELLSAIESGIIRQLAISRHDNTGELVIPSEYFFDQIDKLKDQDGQDEATVQMLESYQDLCDDNPANISFRTDELNEYGIHAAHITFLVKSGFLTLCPGRSGLYNLTIPNLGMYVKLVTTARLWVLNTIKKSTWKELLESALTEKMEGSKQKWRDLRGLKMEWIMKDCHGGGWCEPFSTPVGRGWKLTGQKF
ncbi:hypothetical protein NADFUDRAFT_46981 [Nadsonia fulvescens var. elongata DSM 6958]|uniref:Uncharacterized protein n=1 Tax=Nadsonia fulvescens var. elongata DSM 6958 TaxID=857566 RepID=A0A1E3PIJ0_9ASCO|nr:hypothetical protein NADFUDRAFT_46981 [Nadsonia fulvescens var. elongata DSM 6958]